MKKRSMKIATREDILTAELPEGEKVMWRFCEAVKNETMLSAHDIGFLNTAFNKILNGEAPKKALKIERSQGRKRTLADVDKEYRIAMEALQHPRAEVAADNKISMQTVRRHLRNHGHAVQQYLDWIGSIPASRARYAEMVKIFGKEIGEYPAAFVHRIAKALEAAKPSEYLSISSTIKTILNQK